MVKHTMEQDLVNQLFLVNQLIHMHTTLQIMKYHIQLEHHALMILNQVEQLVEDHILIQIKNSLRDIIRLIMLLFI